MSRGDRSRPERTAEERQRDREERERRRTGRSSSDAEATPTESVIEAPLEVTPDPYVEEPSEQALEHPPAEWQAEHQEPLVAELQEPLVAEPSFESTPLQEEPEPEQEQPEPEPEPVVEQPPAEIFDPPAEPPEALEMATEPAEALEMAPESPAEPPVAPRSVPLVPPPPLPPLPAAARERRGSAAPSRARAAAPLARVGALVALATVVVVAAILLIHSLTSSKSKAPVAAPAVVKVLIPEGKTRAQIAEIAKAAGLKGSYRAAAKSSSLLNPAHYGAPKGTPDLEGFLFPATYELDRGTQVSQLVHEQLIAFQENFRSEYFRRAKALHVSAYQLLIVASMIEREAQVPGDRAKIAAVIYNRLADGMPLGIDAAIYYAVEEQQHIATYTHELTESQLHIDSPYNTRTHTGLPPTPISNPGVASIKAAAHPDHVAYLYYVAGADGCGEQVFSDTQVEFEANAAAYEAAVKRNGGHPPSCKHH